ncbi:MAG: transcriptional repressor NrdR [Rickettsiaceae bacterium]|jgi:transcriptional repressor NrdR|nr:transcriptional repressor NrdR [Rickettsiaceae bacterium]
MLCPLCQFEDTQVKDSRNSSDYKTVRRRRFCPKCKFRFTTIERVQLREIFVIKRSGLKKPFDREKIVKSIAAAVRKRNISQDQVNEIADNIIRELENLGTKEIPTRRIGETILKWLAQCDEVAYIRFASVYKDFTSAKDFANFISKLKNEV